MQNKKFSLQTPKILRFENLLMGMGILNATMVFLASGSKGLLTSILSIAIPFGVKVLIDIRNHSRDAAVSLRDLKASQHTEVAELIRLTPLLKQQLKATVVEPARPMAGEHHEPAH